MPGLTHHTQKPSSLPSEGVYAQSDDVKRMPSIGLRVSVDVKHIVYKERGGGGGGGGGEGERS